MKYCNILKISIVTVWEKTVKQCSPSQKGELYTIHM